MAKVKIPEKLEGIGVDAKINEIIDCLDFLALKVEAMEGAVNRLNEAVKATIDFTGELKAATESNLNINHE